MILNKAFRDQSLFIYMGGGGGGVKAISDWLEGGAKLFYEEV